MDAVILAAGKSERLTGIVAPYQKPLLVVNGKPLITDLVEKASKVSAQIVVVVAPENALQITQVVSDEYDVQFVVQPRPKGPGDAFKRGLRVTTSDHALLLLSDNIVPDLRPFKVRSGKYPKDANVISTQRMLARDAERFTYFDTDRRKWFEKEPCPVPEATVLAWCGPVRVRTATMMRLLVHTPIFGPNGEELIGPQFNFLHDQCRPDVESYDIVTPEMVTEVTKR